MTAPNAGGPGFFGKLPARGDFLSWRIPAELTPRWDDWLGDLTLAAREAAGPAWPEIWLTAPLWHFTLGAGLVAQHAACGLLIASVDRVGRMFPFTIIGLSGGQPEEAWSARIEALALASLDDDASLDALQAGLDELGPPRLPSAVGAGQSIWWCRGSEATPASRRTMAGLPSLAAASAMIVPPRPADGTG